MKGFPVNVLCGIWLVLAASACASAGANRPSKELLQAIPNGQTQLTARSWTNRVAVLDLLVIQRLADGKPLCELRCDLPPADYAYVLDAILDGMNEQFTDVDAKALEASLPAWVHLIKTFKLDSAVDRIASLLQRDNANLKGFSLLMLRVLDARTHDAAVARLLQSSDKRWRRLARETLIELRSKEVVPILAEESHEEHELRRNAALASLEKIADPSAIPTLKRSLSDPSEINRIAALRALMAIFEKQITGTNLIPFARQVFHNSKEIETKWQALAWMANYGDPESVGPIMERLTGENPPMFDDTLRQVSLRVLIPAFIAALESDRIYAGNAVADMHVREYFVYQLGRMKVSQSVPVLSKLCSPEFPYLRHQAVQALGEIASPESVPFLIEMLGEKVVLGMSPHDDVVVALFKIRDGRATAALKKHLTTPGLELGSLVFIFNYSVFPDVTTTRQNQINIDARGTPAEVIAQASARSKIPIHILPPAARKAATNTPALPIVTMPKGHPLDSWLTLATTSLSEAYETRFHYVIGDKEAFIVANSRLPETFVQIFEKTVTR